MVLLRAVVCLNRDFQLHQSINDGAKKSCRTHRCPIVLFCCTTVCVRTYMDNWVIDNFPPVSLRRKLYEWHCGSVLGARSAVHQKYKYLKGNISSVRHAAGAVCVFFLFLYDIMQ